MRGWGIAVAHPNPVSCLCQQGYDIPRMNVKISSSSRHSMAYRPARSRSASESNRATQGLVQRKSRTFAGPIPQPLLRSPSLPPSFRLTNLQPPPLPPNPPPAMLQMSTPVAQAPATAAPGQVRDLRGRISKRLAGLLPLPAFGNARKWKEARQGSFHPQPFGNARQWKSRSTCSFGKSKDAYTRLFSRTQRVPVRYTCGSFHESLRARRSCRS